jgi:UvrD/REP helicase N-terminal domain
MIHRDRDEPRAEILFHLPHEMADERLQVRELRTVRRRHDEPKLMAITFTEFAAGELRERIARYLQEILSGRVPEELRLAFPNGPTRERSRALQKARSASTTDLHDNSRLLPCAAAHLRYPSGSGRLAG